MKKTFYAVMFTVLFACCATGALASTPATGEAGLVLTVQAGAWVERDGLQTALNVKSAVRPGDVLVTDATGRVQVIFADDTTISLGADTRVAVAEFLFDAPGQKPSFSANMAQGAARFVTGKVVEQNREGFSVTTPQATVGIRGTTFAVNVSPEGMTTVIGLKVDGAFPIAVTNLKTGAVSTIDASGMAVDAAAGGNTNYQAQPGQFSQTGSAVSGQPKVAAAGSGASGTGGTPPAATVGQTATPAAQIASQTVAPAFAAAAVEGASLAPASVSAGALYSGDSGAANSLANSSGKPANDVLVDLGPQPGVPGLPGPTLTATYSGTLYSAPTGPWAPVGNFSFDADLTAGSGTINNTLVTINSGWGSGLTASQKVSDSVVSNGAFDVNFTVDNPGGASSNINPGNSGHMYSGANGGINSAGVNGQWDISTNGGGKYHGGGDMYFEGNKQ